MPEGRSITVPMDIAHPTTATEKKSKTALDATAGLHYVPSIANANREIPMDAIAILARHSDAAARITKDDVAAILDRVSGTTFASFVSVTTPTLAAKNKGRNVQKVSFNNVQLFNHVDAYKLYMEQVKRSAAKIEGNDADAVANFETQETWHRHTDVFSVVVHPEKNKFYLYAIFNSARSEWFIDGKAATKEEVAALMTPSAARDLLTPKEHVENKTHGIKHDTVVRTFSLDNIVAIKAMKQTVEVA